MKNRHILFCLFCGLALAGCEKVPTVAKGHNDGAVFTLHDIIITTSDGSSWGSYAQAAKASGDHDNIIVEQIKLFGHRGHDFAVFAGQGQINPKNMSGSLYSGVEVEWDKSYKAQTAKAFFDRRHIITHEKLQLSGPFLQAVFDGASFDNQSGTISSLGTVSGDISAATF